MSVRYAPTHHVRGINVLDVAFDFRFELFAKPLTDIAELLVASGIGTFDGDVLLPGAFGEDNHGVALGIQQVAHVLDDAIRSVHRKRDFGNQTTIHLSVC